MLKTEEVLLNTTELCEALKVSTETIRRWKKDGLPVVNLGERSVRFRMSEVIKWRSEVMAAKKEKRKGVQNG